MNYLHTMLRVENLEASLDFFCGKLGLLEVSRRDSHKGRFTLVFLAAPGDAESAERNAAPLIELTHNWPDEKGNSEKLSSGRNFGHLAFRVANIYETCQELMKKGVIINRPPRDGHMAFIKSPDGHSIELLQKGEPLEPQAPWAEMENIGNW